jgi:hypothetical protein
MRYVILVAALIAATQFLFGCDMRHAVRIELKEGVITNDGKFTVPDVMATLKPVLEKNELNCVEKLEQQRHEVKCKTWAHSLSTVQIYDKGGAARVIVEDESRIFFLWTPQPYGRLRAEVINSLKNKYGVDHLNCGQGFGLEIPCDEWPPESKRGK